MKKVIPKIYFVLLILLTASLTFSYKINSLCIIALMIIWLIDTKFIAKFRVLIREPFFALNALLFCLYLVGVALSDDKATARFFVEKNLSLVALPLVMLSMKKITDKEFFIIAKIFIACTIMVMALAIGLALNHWMQIRDRELFFYHALANHVGLSAIIASLLCTVSLALLFALPATVKLKWPAVIFLSCCLVLLSSKLFLLLLGVMLILNVSRYIGKRVKVAAGAGLLLLILLFATVNNPVKRRFSDISKFQTGYLQAKKYDPGMYFDGLSMRLIFIKFGLEIFHEDGKYLLGVGTGDAEHLLKKKIIAYDMYLGDGTKDKEGYLQYGFHNQFLQKMLQLGLIGLLLFLSVITYCFWFAVRYRSLFLANLVLLFTLTFFTDTLLEHQVGLVMFLTFSCLAMQVAKRKNEEKPRSDDPEQVYLR